MKKAVNLMKEVSLISDDGTVNVSLEYLRAVLRLSYLEGCLDVLTSPKVQKGNTDIVPKYWGDIQNVEFEIESLEELPVRNN